MFSADAGDGAIYELARIIHRFRTELPEPNLTFNVGLIAGGEQVSLDEGKIRASANRKTNIIAATAIARGDLRPLSAEQAARVKDKMADNDDDTAQLGRATCRERVCPYG